MIILVELVDEKYLSIIIDRRKYILVIYKWSNYLTRFKKKIYLYTYLYKVYEGYFSPLNKCSSVIINNHY